MRIKRWAVQWALVYPQSPSCLKTWHDTGLRFLTKKRAERARIELAHSVPLEDKTRLHRVKEL